MSPAFVRRVLTAIPTLIAISILVYAIIALAPGDPLAAYANNPAVPPAVQDRIRHNLGLDDPLPVRYVKWARSFVAGDFGYSFSSRSPVRNLIGQRLPTTLFVIGLAYLVSVIIAIPIGIISAVKQYSVFDNLMTSIAFIGFALPTFFTGLLFILIFSVKLGWLPMIYRSEIDTGGLSGVWEQIKQSIMPIAVLALANATVLIRYTRSAMLDAINEDYMRTARAKGLSEWQVLNRHALRNALIPVVTVIALGIPAIFNGSVIVEQIFRVPGIGTLLINGINSGDTAVVMDITFIYAILVVVFNLVADYLYTILDPRIRYS